MAGGWLRQGLLGAWTIFSYHPRVTTAWGYRLDDRAAHQGACGLQRQAPAAAAAPARGHRAGRSSEVRPGHADPAHRRHGTRRRSSCRGWTPTRRCAARPSGRGRGGTMAFDGTSRRPARRCRRRSRSRPFHFRASAPGWRRPHNRLHPLTLFFAGWNAGAAVLHCRRWPPPRRDGPGLGAGRIGYCAIAGRLVARPLLHLLLLIAAGELNVRSGLPLHGAAHPADARAGRAAQAGRSTGCSGWRKCRWRRPAAARGGDACP